MSRISLYKATLGGLDFISKNYVEPIAIYWPCGEVTEMSHPHDRMTNLEDLSLAIGEHAINCEFCEM